MSNDFIANRDLNEQTFRNFSRQCTNDLMWSRAKAKTAREDADKALARAKSCEEELAINIAYCDKHGVEYER